MLDSVGEIAFWLRNVAKHRDACWLPTAGGRTYTDFIAKLKDDRLLVVEYKGGHLVSDAVEKQAVGRLWQDTSGDRCVYVFVGKERDGMNVKAQIEQATAQ